jgi:uncharacterized protein (DUF427 family)
MTGFPAAIVPVGHVEPVPRRIRAMLDGRTVLDTTRASYLWEWPFYPQYYVPRDDVDADVLARLGHRTRTSPSVPGAVRFAWTALDAWFEEDEEVFVHPRNPYTRVDALRSTRRVRVELDGVLLAESSAPVLVFETGLPTRSYVDRSAVRWEHLVASDTWTPCPYKGRTSAYWSVRAGDALHPDLAWSYDFPTRALAPIAGLVAFYDEKVDVTVDGVRQERPVTHFSS